MNQFGDQVRCPYCESKETKENKYYVSFVGSMFKKACVRTTAELICTVCEKEFSRHFGWEDIPQKKVKK